MTVLSFNTELAADQSSICEHGGVLREVAAREPVYLNKSCRGRYALLDIADYEQAQATVRLLSQLAEGDRAGCEKRWLSIEDVEKSLERPSPIQLANTSN